LEELPAFPDFTIPFRGGICRADIIDCKILRGFMGPWKMQTEAGPKVVVK
jgi:hypothetical protein